MKYRLFVGVHRPDEEDRAATVEEQDIVFHNAEDLKGKLFDTVEETLEAASQLADCWCYLNPDWDENMLNGFYLAPIDRDGKVVGDETWSLGAVE